MADHAATPGSRGWVLIADLVAAAAFGLGAFVWLRGPIAEISLLGLSFTASSPNRSFGIGVVVLALRHWRAGPQPLLLAGWRKLQRVSREDGLANFGQPIGTRAAELIAVVLGYAVFVGLATWPQVTDLSAVPDLGDPLFSAWRLGWVAHQLPIDVTRLFDANIFHPERLTLAYSDAMIAPALVAAPFLWLGAPLVATTTALFLAAWVFSGVAAYYLVRALTGRREAAIVAGAIFAIYPYRSEHYSHLELQFALWMPLACWALHRTVVGGRLRHGLLTGLAFALQTLSSLYYGLFLAVYLAAIFMTLWLYRGRPRGVLKPLAAGALVAGVLVAPVASQYVANRPMFGERLKPTIESYSALPADYLAPHFRSAVYGRWAAGGAAERQLFPGTVALVIALLACWPPWNAKRLAYAAAGLIAFDGSLGFHGITYPFLHDWLSPFRGLRVPARFSILVGLTLAVMAGFLVARALEKWPTRGRLVTAALLALVFVDMRPQLDLEPVWNAPPGIYSAMSAQPGAVLAELPLDADAKGIPLEHYYTYFSTFHWHPILNGASGFIPPSWYDFEVRMQTFPSQRSLDYLRARGVEYVAVHGGLYKDPEALAAVRAALFDRPDLVRVAAARFAGDTSELYQFRPLTPP